MKCLEKRRHAIMSLSDIHCRSRVPFPYRIGIEIEWWAFKIAEYISRIGENKT